MMWFFARNGCCSVGNILNCLKLFLILETVLIHSQIFQFILPPKIDPNVTVKMGESSIKCTACFKS